jgi:glutathione peroxidase
MPSFFDTTVQSLEGEADLLGPLRGKVLLAVNVASRCGLTPQYTELEALHRELSDRGFAVVGFPCNQFGAQEPGTERQIAEFCSVNYGVTFPMSAKLDVNGANRHAAYRYLTSPQTGIAGDIEWNFEKFLIGSNGEVLKRYPPQTDPRDNGLLQDIAETLEGGSR